MFYSHEILTSHQYGVATIWLAATMNTKACMSRKAIGEVNIRKAVKKILNPGAPLALRLQSNLLYGASRVYNQKTIYMLDDATRMSQKLRMTHSLSEEDHLVAPNIVQAPRRQIVLEDNPVFLWDPLPIPDFLSTEAALRTSLGPSQNNTLRTSSHMSPRTPSSIGSRHRRASRNASIFLDLGQSPDRSSINMPFNTGSSPMAKQGAIRIAGDEELIPLDDLALDLDFGLEGDHIRPDNDLDFGFLDDIRQAQGFVNGNSAKTAKSTKQPPDDIAMLLEDEAPIIPEEEPLPAAEAFAPTKKTNIRSTDQTVGQEEPNTAQAAPIRRTRAPRLQNYFDKDIEIPDSQIREDCRGYLETHKDLAKRKLHREFVRNSKRNAAAYVFGNGIGHIDDIHPSIKHPLAPHFAGPNFLNSLCDPTAPTPIIDSANIKTQKPQPEIIDKDEDFSLNLEIARRAPDDILSIGDERSRRGTPSVDHHSSLAPWIRGNSVLSSAKSARDPSGLASRLASPLHGRSQLQDIEHLSSEAGNSLTDYNVGNLAAVDQEVGPVANEFNAFKEYVRERAWQRRVSMSGSASMRRSGGRRGVAVGEKMVWMDFVEFAGPLEVTKAEAASAFLNMLTMATKNECKIRSEYISADDPMALGTHIIEIGIEPTEFRGVKRSFVSDE